MFFLKQLYLSLPLLACLAIAGNSQCLIISGGETETTEATDYNWMYTDASCEGPSCPNGNFIYLTAGRGNPCTQHEPATVFMNKFTLENSSIAITYAIRGQRSGWLFRFGGMRQPCNDIGTIFEEDVMPCLPCEIVEPLSCEDLPGEGSRYASCSIRPACTASCANSSPGLTMTAFDTCYYPSGISHYVEVYAHSFPGGVAAGTEGHGATYVDYFPYCTGYIQRLCNGMDSVDNNYCRCTYSDEERDEI